MLVCYVEDVGDAAILTSPTCSIQPVVSLLALTLEESRLRDFTVEFVDLKARFFPGLCQSRKRLERILVEIKGKEVRAAFRAANATHHRRHTFVGFMDSVLDLVERHQCKIFGRVWIKAIGASFDGLSVYGTSVQAVCNTFHHQLESKGTTGILVPDPRSKTQDRNVSFTIFTQKFRIAGDAYPRLVEMPLFGQSVNHAGVQVCDLLCSGLLYPIATYTYCLGHVQNVHVDPGFAVLKNRYCARMKGLTYEYYSQTDHAWRGGIVVSDRLGQKHSGHLLR